MKYFGNVSGAEEAALVAGHGAAVPVPAAAGGVSGLGSRVSGGEKPKPNSGRMPEELLATWLEAAVNNADVWTSFHEAAFPELRSRQTEIVALLRRCGVSFALFPGHVTGELVLSIRGDARTQAAWRAGLGGSSPHSTITGGNAMPPMFAALGGSSRHSAIINPREGSSDDE